MKEGGRRAEQVGRTTEKAVEREREREIDLSSNCLEDQRFISKPKEFDRLQLDRRKSGVGVLLFGCSKFRARGFWTSPPWGDFLRLKLSEATVHEHVRASPSKFLSYRWLMNKYQQTPISFSANFATTGQQSYFQCKGMSGSS